MRNYNEEDLRAAYNIPQRDDDQPDDTDQRITLEELTADLAHWINRGELPVMYRDNDGNVYSTTAITEATYNGQPVVMFEIQSY
jgi:hypothetical protein